METAGVEPTCPFCRGPLGPKTVDGALVMGTSYGVRMCAGCLVGVTVPPPSAALLAAAYSPGQYRGGDGKRFNPLVESLVRLFRNARRRRVERFARPGRILDVGCGRGLFLHVMERHGWEAAGIEVDEETARAASARYGITVRSGPPAAWGFADGSFDAITLNHSLEHMPDPADILGACGRLLRPGGLLLVAVPDIDSLQARAGGALWFHLDPPFHLYHFSGEGLARFLRGSGFAVVRVRRFDLEYNIYGWFQTLLNLSGISRNFLFDRLRGARGDAARSRSDLLRTALLAPACLPLSVALSLFESFVVKKGGTVEIFAVRA